MGIITNGIDLPVDLAINSRGDLFVANMGGNGQDDQGSVSVYHPPKYWVATPTIITSGISRPDAIGVDRSDDLFVANLTESAYGGSTGSITEYSQSHNYTEPPLRAFSYPGSQPEHLIVHGKSIFVQDCSTVRVYPIEPHKGGFQTITAPGCGNLALDASGNLFITDPYSTGGLGTDGMITEYSRDGYRKVLAIRAPLADHSPIALSDDNDLLVASNGLDGVRDVLVYRSPSFARRLSIQPPQAHIVSIVAGPGGSVFLASDKGGSAGLGYVAEYQTPNYSGSALLTLTSGVDVPTAILPIP